LHVKRSDLDMPLGRSMTPDWQRQRGAAVSINIGDQDTQNLQNSDQRQDAL